MHQGTKAVEERLDRFFKDKIQPAIYRDHIALSITAWQAPREPVPFAEATTQQYEAVDLGWRFGRAWSTIWLKVSGSIPESWSANQEGSLAAEIVIDFGYNTSRSGFQAEALAYDLAGKPIKAIAPKNSWLPWSYAKKRSSSTSKLQRTPMSPANTLLNRQLLATGIPLLSSRFMS